MATITDQTKHRIATAFFGNGLLRFGEFTLKSGITSPFYIDMRKVQSHPEVFHTVTAAYAEMIEDTEDSILLAGVPEAATPLASAVGYELKRPLVQPRKAVKDHGTKSSIEGDFQVGDSVILLDDLITKGDSKLEAITQLENTGLVVEMFVVLIDRGQGGVETVWGHGYTIEAAMTISELVNSLYASGKISRQQHTRVVDFVHGATG